MPKTLLSEIRKLSPEIAEKIRQAYFKAAEGLDDLVALTEQADLQIALSESRDSSDDDLPLIGEHLIFCHALEVFNTSRMGKVV